MANERIPLLKGKPIKDAVTVFVGGQAFDGWENVSITKNLESIANSFSISLFDKFEGLKQNWPLKPGVSIKINIGNERVITGNIETLNPSFTDEGRSYIVGGRSLAGDLIDAMHLGPYEYKNISLTKLAEELVKPFGLKVFESVTPNIIDKFAVKPNETVFEALDRAARAQGFFFISTRGGNIRLTRAARARSFSNLEQDINILAATANYNDSKRHNIYFVKGQTPGSDTFFGNKASQAEGFAQDLGITRHRPLILISESNVDGAKATTRAEWEASLRLAQAIKINVTVQGWKQDDGSLWGINQVTLLTSSFLGLNRDMLIISVEHNDGAEEGKTSTLTLTDPQAYTPEPEKNKKKKDDIFSVLGPVPLPKD